ncbi:hypothetical protein L2E82_20599 [Cichorium intybus]|uniref:Uncharacterized protein n=1 Tax=Cichorium intybus TaxID=13427 RepID=A0ACB9DU42_CICIN|nr:hypothetical protein L2E82_20599 [Cichorium intybus]
MVAFRFASFELSSNQKVRLRKEDVDDKPWWHSNLPSVAVLRKARKKEGGDEERGCFVSPAIGKRKNGDGGMNPGHIVDKLGGKEMLLTKTEETLLILMNEVNSLLRIDNRNACSHVFNAFNCKIVDFF